MPATYLSSQQTAAQKAAVFKELSQAFPSCKLLYVTPEQFVKSNALVDVLTRLHQRGLLACFVVDEVRALLFPCLLPQTSLPHKRFSFPEAGKLQSTALLD